MLPQTRRLVTQFYSTPKIFCERPEVRFRGKRLMNLSTLQAFNLFCQDNSGVTITYRSFLRLRPANVLPFKKYHFNCKCTYCCNVELLLRSIRNFVSRCNDLSETVRAKMKLLTVYDLQKVILCEKRMGCLMFSKNCVNSVC